MMHSPHRRRGPTRPANNTFYSDFVKVGIDTPKIEIRYENLTVEGEIEEVYVGHKAPIPSLFNTACKFIQSALRLIGIVPSNKKKVKILESVSGIVKPSRLTLLLGPPGGGKTTFLLALSGKLDHALKVSGNVSYCGHQLSEFIPQRTCAYISPHNLHSGEMTVRETLDFSGRCLGVGPRYRLLTEILKREKQAGIKPDPDIDAFMKATSVPGQETNLITDYIIKKLGLETCADAMVGDQMIRGISGGEKKRVTTGEMLVGPARVLLMDEISNGLDSSTTYHIIKVLRQMVHVMDLTAVISLLQPDPETYKLFDDVILMSEGHIVYQGPCQNVLEFFESIGFKCPDRKGVADFLQEVTSRKDQEQYWYKTEQPYRYIRIPEFTQAFKSFHIGQKLETDIFTPYDKSKAHPDALVKEKYGKSNVDLLKACFYKEWLLTKRNYALYIFKIFQLTFMSLVAIAVFYRTKMNVGSLEDGGKFIGSLFFGLLIVMFNGMAELVLTVMRLPVFYKHRDSLLYPAWAFALPIWVLKIPLSLMESGIWVILTYYAIGYAPDVSRFFKQFLTFFAVHQMALSLFRFIAAVARTDVLANTLGVFTSFMILVLGGFVVSKNDTEPWVSWAFYASPMMYAQNAVVINEFLDKRWSAPYINSQINASTMGEALLKSRSFFTKDYWFYGSIGVLIGFSCLFNMLFIISLTLLNPITDTKAVIRDECDMKKSFSELNQSKVYEGANIEVESTSEKNGSTVCGGDRMEQRGMVLPFHSLSLAFNHVNYSIDVPVEMKARGFKGGHLQLLKDVSGAFRPGILTALAGVSGAGKTTLMDVLAGRKTGGYMEGSIFLSGFPKNQATFARVSGYCEQNDIHTPNVTVYESLLYSAWLRLSSDVNTRLRQMFVDELIELMELNPIRDALVGLPGVDGLSIEQRKRLTIAVELVANPSIIFLDEPTSGLDARAAAIVMRTVRNTVDTGRTVVCTIHQPSIDIFESFDELILMKMGGQIVYAGPLGQHSHKLIEYFEGISGVPKITNGYNPATWALEVTSLPAENQLKADFAEIYFNSSLYGRNQDLIKEISTPLTGSDDLVFRTKYAQPFLVQFEACLWKQHWSYWRNLQYNVTRFSITVLTAVTFGVVFFNLGEKIEKPQDLVSMLGAFHSAVVFLGAMNQNGVQPIVGVERTVFYRERAAGMYSSLPYALAQVTVESIYIAIQTFIYACLLYPMIGFPWKIAKFLWFYYYLLTSIIYFTMFGMMIVSLSPNPQISAVIVYFFLCLWNLFSGFIIPRPHIPVWSRWYYWANPLSWTIYGLLTSQVGQENLAFEMPGVGSITVKGYMKAEFGFEYDFLPVVAAAHIGWVIKGKDGKPMKSSRNVQFEVPKVDFAQFVQSQTGYDGIDPKGDMHKKMVRRIIMLMGVQEALNNLHLLSRVNVAIPIEVVDKISSRFNNTLYGYFLGKRLAFPVVENYFKHAWAKFRIERTMLHEGFFFFQFATRARMEQKDDIKVAPVWVKIHKGRNTYARALVELEAKKEIVDSLVVAIPYKNREGHSLETDEVSPNLVDDDGFMRVTRKQSKGKHVAKPRNIKGIKLTKPKVNLVWEKKQLSKAIASTSKLNENVTIEAKKQNVNNEAPVHPTEGLHKKGFVDDGINIMTHKNSFKSLMEADKILDVVQSANLDNINDEKAYEDDDDDVEEVFVEKQRVSSGKHINDAQKRASTPITDVPDV
nr:ABC transporter G family member 39-like isoform X1 [Tanacetum cinerariifolium]